MTYRTHSKTGLDVSKTGKVRGYKEIRIHQGYLEVVYFTSVPKIKGSGFKTARIHLHRLVAETYLGASRLHVNHKNGNKFDNRLRNLEYVTRGGNAEHAHRTGLIKVRGTGNGRAKLTEKQALHILRSDPKLKGVVGKARQETAVALGEKYDLNWMSVRNIWSRTSWAHLQI